MNIVLLGPPGAGKGTQAKRLQSVLGVPHIASGDIFREIRREDTPLAHEIRQYMDSGQYVPDQLTCEVLLERLDRPDAKRGFVLDGFPRTLGQAEALDDALTAEKRALDLALYITAPREVLLKRLQGRVVCPKCHAVYNLETKPPRIAMVCDACGSDLERRTDEAPEVVTTRLDTFLAQTKPLVQYYRHRHRLVEIDGTNPLREVEAQVDAAIGLRGVR